MAVKDQQFKYFLHGIFNIVISFSIVVAHVFEEVHEAERGVEFMTTTREDWKGSSYEVHIAWHLALYYLGEQRNTCSLHS